MPVEPEATKYFWDVRVGDLNTERDAAFIIGRLLEYGDIAAIRWLLSIYDSERITEILKTKRGLSRLSGLFWQRIFGLDKNELVCLQTPSHNQPTRTWPPSARAAS